MPHGTGEVAHHVRVLEWLQSRSEVEDEASEIPILYNRQYAGQRRQHTSSAARDAELEVMVTLTVPTL